MSSAGTFYRRYAHVGRQFVKFGLVGGAVSSLVGELEPGAARGITEIEATVLDADVEHATDSAGFEFGAD